ncbi:hypothetical protein F4859DRAFT_519957 [Xylaria cf. heliscus]|nr:hypothetical protein F4859DRAFT_519957 [Xylaria cf. heliscus]
MGIFGYTCLGLKDPNFNIDGRPDQSLDTHPIKEAQAGYFEQLLLKPGESTAGFFTYAAQGNFDSGSGSSLMQSGF